jgi:hypothetical protein
MSQYTLATPIVPEDYKYTLEQCDVEDKTALATFRDKRRVWLSWLNTDEHHAIWQVISSMVWHDVYFRTFAELADKNPDSGIHNSLVSEAIVTGYFATQVLSIRRLMDTRNDVISLPRLLKELRRHLRLFTRENFVAFDGLPYDHEDAQQRVMQRHLAQGGGPFWGEQSGPDAHIPAARAHKQFDRLTGVGPGNRRRDDRLPKRIIDTLDDWLREDVIDEIVKWSHTFLAHAAGPTSPNRNDIAAAAPTVDKITTAIKCFVRVADAATGFILFESGRGMLVPVPQFNQFQMLENSLMPSDRHELLRKQWDKLTEERNAYLEGTESALISGPKARIGH